MVSPEGDHWAVASTTPALDVCGLAQAQATLEFLTTVAFVVPAGTDAMNVPRMSFNPPVSWDTESYPADSTASPKRRCAARKTSTERAT